MPNTINVPSDSSERQRKPRNPLFAEPLKSRISKREVVCLRTMKAIMAEVPDEIRRMEVATATHEQLARPAMHEIVAPPEVTDFPSNFPVVSGEGTIVESAQPHDNVAFLSAARARVDAHYQGETAMPNQAGDSVTEIKTYLEQHPRETFTAINPVNLGRQMPIYPPVDTPASYYSQSNVYQLTAPQQGNPLFQNPNQPNDHVDDNLRALGYREDQNVAA